MIGKCTLAENNDIITENDIKILKNADTYSAGLVVHKIKKIFNAKGKEAIVLSIPIISDKVIEMSKQKIFSENDGELLIDYIWILSVSEDKNAIPALLAMLSSHLSSIDIPKAFLKFGKSIVPVLIDSLNSKSITTRDNTSLVLKRMKELNTNNDFFSIEEIKNIHNILVKIIKIENINNKYLPIVALKEFGDKNDLTLLNKIITDDKYSIKRVNGDDFYINRYGAQETIKKINKK